MIALDANFIIRFIIGSSENEANDLNAKVFRVLQLISNDKFLIPTPALSEVLTRLGQNEMIELCTLFTKSKDFVVQPFDMASSIEAAMAAKKARDIVEDKRGGSQEPWQKVKVDFQIAAIAKVHSASCIYTSDSDIRKIATLFDLDVCAFSDLEAQLPESQRAFTFDAPSLH